MQTIAQLIFAIILVVGIVGGITINNYIKLLRENQGKIQSLQGKVGEREQRIAELEKRIAVLERIVTDSRYELDQQFNELDKTG
ncbi:MAG: hypothetical protein KJO54_10125 [Gammaproteobacteria bacterium]|nr:hypothetical protein [Gammaproteobacteria bacterium]NNF62315.1 hypothetical protein [Gammaproteobacteria bacterium]NNM20879.1 hypothetical protein [Gammaproteobacteria bacterium]